MLVDNVGRRKVFRRHENSDDVREQPLRFNYYVFLKFRFLEGDDLGCVRHGSQDGVERFAVACEDVFIELAKSRGQRLGKVSKKFFTMN